MRTLVTDLEAGVARRLGLLSNHDAAVCAEDVAAARDCTGCFGCFTRTPGVCALHDRLRDVASLMGASDELDIVSRSVFGWVSPAVKRVLDRLLAGSDARFEVHDGMMCHRPRYAVLPRLRIWLYGDSTAQERACATVLARAMAKTGHDELAGIAFPADPSEIAACHMEDAEAPGGAGDGQAGEPFAIAAPGSSPRLARRIALVNLSPHRERSTTNALLDDFEEALGVYAGLDAVDNGGGDGVPVPRIERFSWNRTGAFDPKRLGQVDTVVFAYPLYVNALPAPAVELLETLASSAHAGGAFAPGTRIYAISNCGFFEPAQIHPSFGLLEAFCSRVGAVWGGGLAVGGGPVRAEFMGGPRMGMLRRGLSEAMDRLILAVRCGSDAGVIDTAPPMPRALYRFGAEARWRAEARHNEVDLGRQVPYRGQYDIT